MVTAGDYRQDVKDTARVTKSVFERNKGPILVVAGIIAAVYGMSWLSYLCSIYFDAKNNT